MEHFIEKMSNYPDLVVILTEQYPFREKDLFDNMIKKLVTEGLDVSIASKKISGGVWLKNKKGSHQMIVDGLIPNKIRNEIAFRSSFGLGCVVRPKNLRQSNLYIGKTEIDWSYNLMDRGLKFNNPHAKGSCGCKTSFMIDMPQEEQRVPSWMT